VRALDRFADERIRIHTPVSEPDVVIIVAPTLIGNAGLVEGVSESTIFVVNTEKDPAQVKATLGLTTQTLHTVPANKISHALFKREIPNSAMMGAFARACPDVIALEDLVQEASHIFSHMQGKDLVEKNLDAIRSGYVEVKTV
jgi:pyruvate ferredoxin oxidoreductase gamma subunit